MISKSIFGTIAVAACAVGVALQVKHTLAVPIQPERPSVPVQGVAEWVPFSASAQGRQSAFTTNERYFRDSHGSFREEISAPGRPTLITINNYDDRMIYARGVTGEWAAMPMPSNMRSRGPFTSSRGLGLSSTAEDYNGLRVYRRTVFDQIELQAPELNFFAVWRQDSEETKAYTNIVRAEQPTGLFHPPPDVPVKAVSSVRDLFPLRQTPKARD